MPLASARDESTSEHNISFITRRKQPVVEETDEEEIKSFEEHIVPEEEIVPEVATTNAPVPKKASKGKGKVLRASKVTIEGAVNVIPSDITKDDMDRIRDRYGVPEGVVLRTPFEYEVACSDASHEVCL